MSAGEIVHGVSFRACSEWYPCAARAPARVAPPRTAFDDGVLDPFDVLGGPKHLIPAGCWHDDGAVVVGHDDVPGLNGDTVDGHGPRTSVTRTRSLPVRMNLAADQIG